MEINGGATTQKNEINDKLVPDEISQCSLVRQIQIADSGEPCSSDAHLSIMTELLGKKVAENEIAVMTPAQKAEIVAATAKLLGVATERDIANHYKFTLRAGLTWRENIGENFKVAGPTDTALLSNYNIDNTLQQWSIMFEKYPATFEELEYAGDDVRGKNFARGKFFAYNFNMADYETTGDTLAARSMQELRAAGYVFAACVINSDVSSGGGKHWMALVADMRGNECWTVEFFNSAGNPPQASFSRWLDKTAKEMQDIIAAEKLPQKVKIIKCCKVDHQKSKTECGVYSLYYIWARLHGVPAEYFMTNEISDILCFEFRQHLFHDGHREAPKVFNYRDFKKGARVQWEREFVTAAGEDEKKYGGNSVADFIIEINEKLAIGGNVLPFSLFCSGRKAAKANVPQYYLQNEALGEVLAAMYLAAIDNPQDKHGEFIATLTKRADFAAPKLGDRHFIVPFSGRMIPPCAEEMTNYHCQYTRNFEFYDLVHVGEDALAAIPGLCHCWDCRAAIEICNIYGDAAEVLAKVMKHVEIAHLFGPPHGILAAENMLVKRRILDSYLPAAKYYIFVPAAADRAGILPQLQDAAKEWQIDTFRSISGVELPQVGEVFKIDELAKAALIIVDEYVAEDNLFVVS